MDWSDERYAKIYTRDTLTWLSLPWEGRCLLPLLIRKVDGAGILETGNLDPAEAVAFAEGLLGEAGADLYLERYYRP